MSSSPFRNWRRASRKSSVPFFPGAWPNSSAHDSIVTKSEREAVDAQELSDTAIGDHVAQLGQGSSSLPSGSSRSEASHNRSEATHRKSDEPLLQHIDHVTDFHRRLSHSLNYSQSGSIGSIPTEVDLQMVSSRTDTFSSSSGTTIATPGPLSPATSLSFPLLVSSNANNHRKKSFSLPRIMTQHSTSSNPIENSISTRTSAQLDSPLQSYGHGLPPLSLPPHTLSFSPQSVASYFSSSDQSRKTADTNMSPPLPPSPPTSTIPASFIIPSPVHQDYASLPEIPSSSGFATSFYPVLDSRHENYTPGIHDMLSPAPSGSSRVYGDDSPVLPSDEEINPKFLSPLMSPYQREGLSPSSAEMDAFGLAAEHIPHDARSDISIPTSLRSQFVAEPGIRDSTFDDADDTLRPDVYANRSRSPSLSLSLSSIESLNLDPRFTYTHDFELRRNKRRSEPPLSAPVISPDVPVVTTVTSSALSVHATSPNDKPSGLDKVKKFGGKLKKLFSFKGKAMASEGPIPGIGVSRSTQVTNVEYASEHPIPLGETKRTKPNPVPSPSRARRSRRQSLPVLSMSGSSVTVSRPKPLRPASFLAMDPAESSSYGLLSSSKLADLQHALGSKVGSKSSIHFSRTRASTSGSKQPNSPSKNPRGQGVEKPLPPTPVTPARERRRSEFVTPTARPAISPGKLRRFSMSPGFGASRIDMLKPHPPLPQKGDVPRLSQETAGGLISGMTQKKKPTTSSRMVKARSMVVGHVYHRKPVPIIDDTDLRKDMVAQDPKPELVPTTGLTTVDSSSPLGQKDFKGVDPPSFLAEPPVLHRSLPITERSVEQKSNKRRSRGFSFTSTVSKRAQKARSMIVGCPDRNAAIVGPANGIQYHRTDTSETRGSSLGCADYEPDLVPDNMSFAPRPGLRSGSSAISVDEVTLDQNSSSGRTTRAMSSQSFVGNTEGEDSLFDISDPMVIANAIRRAEEPGADETTDSVS